MDVHTFVGWCRVTRRDYRNTGPAPSLNHLSQFHRCELSVLHWMILLEVHVVSLDFCVISNSGCTEVQDLGIFRELSRLIA